MSHVGSCQVQSMQHRLHYRQHSMQHVNIALFAMPTFWAHHQHHTNLPRRAQCQLLLLTLLICLQKQHHRLVGNRIRLHTSPTFNAACTLPSLPCQFLGSPSASHHPSSSCTVPAPAAAPPDLSATSPVGRQPDQSACS